ncbi:MAG: SDR family oxidoreductase [Gammaproteobacteria bacterium]|nr:SDR family oxidoreductase [Gammaproteobacteria bacterium]
METVLVTGANRGIGLGFVKYYLDRGNRVIATYRDTQSSTELIQMTKDHDRLESLALDVSSEGSLVDFRNQLGNRPIDIFINNAGVYGPRNSTFDNVDEKNWVPVLQVNAIAPLILTQLIIENLRQSSVKKLVYITSKMGSINDNKGGGSYVYRSSKAALNAVVKSISVDLADEGMRVALLHPGWVRTDMGGPNGLIDIKTSVTGMTKVIDGLEQTSSGGFYNYDGAEIPW